MLAMQAPNTFSEWDQVLKTAKVKGKSDPAYPP